MNTRTIPKLESVRPVREDEIPRPQGIAELREGRYRVTFARTQADLAEVLSLRFEVFNRELGEGLASSWLTGLDRDPFDATCHHLMLVDERRDEVVGTYRLQTAAMARAGSGYYSATEFELAALAPHFEDSVELGRACIRKDHRNGTALFALWRGLAAYLAWSQKRAFFGCCSLTCQDARAGLRLAEELELGGHMSAELRLPARAAYRCDPTAGVLASEVALPALFGTYLRHGARVISEPALDRSFGTIDWLVYLDIAALPARLRRLFFAGLADPLQGQAA
jgi:putative hemolysin